MVDHPNAPNGRSRILPLEDQLRSHHAILWSMIEGSNALVFSVDRELRYTSFNRAYELAMGALYDVEVQVGDPALEPLAPADRELAETKLRRALAGEQFTEVMSVGDAGRGRRLLELFHGPVRGGDNDVAGAVVIGRDISERVRTEEQIRKLSRAVEQSPVSIVITDTSGVMEYVNPKFSQVTGYSAEELIGQNPRLLKSGHTSTEVYREMWRTISSGNEWRGEFQNRHKDGSIFWEEASISAIRDANGTITHYVGVKEDITSRKRAEEELRRTQRQLQHAQKMESIGRLAGGIAHDFNNLLTAINGFSELALDGLPPDHPVRGDIEQIREAGDRAERLTRQLLAFSRQQVLEPRVVSLNDVVSGLVGLLRRLIGEQVVFEAYLTDDLGRVLADPGQIEQVVVNLAVNARDAMPVGGRLIIETANVELDRVYIGHDPETRSGPYAMLAVTDSGCGMTEEVRRRAFEPFFTTKPPGAGSGLGLSMVYGIVRQSGGNIWVFSEPGQGTSVKIYLPRIPDSPGAEPHSAGAIAEYGQQYSGSEWILLVEDDDAVRSLAVQWLTRFGYNVVETGSAEEVLQLAARSDLHLDLLVTDVVMPGVDGTNVAARLREVRPSVRVVYMSGYPDAALGATRSLDDGHGFLQKPFTATGLARKVREALNRR